MQWKAHFQRVFVRRVAWYAKYDITFSFAFFVINICGDVHLNCKLEKCCSLVRSRWLFLADLPLQIQQPAFPVPPNDIVILVLSGSSVAEQRLPVLFRCA